MKIRLKHLQNRVSSTRQDYATINKSIVDKLTPPNMYRFFCLSLYRNDYYKVRWRIKDLAKRTGEEETALKNFNKDIEAVLVRKRYPVPTSIPYLDFIMRSLYCIPPIERPNFITLSHLFMKVDLDIKVKGYYIKLLLIAEDNKILLTSNKLAEKLKMGKKSVESYNLDLYNAGLLKFIPNGLELTPKELLLDNDIAKQRKEWIIQPPKDLLKMAFKSK
ncbi:hypothetical protein Bacsa_1804 [Phocaeicola salanitronis DSM 18170]|uniref:Uncharacterized protein n=1 Tax=Phocaeicola salanitronis (strain DSM 18170 / JCM 13657 / CCUG 60908 / BL78) TaxID=667015 RepID=F0R1Q5_PHOSB|nr:hypothetical protein [Phocaeicola salanitronis]ADY36363.1 hypothetical protein Bacsa_1804 [Phocaeicola salanitronis DSM 18170]